MGERLVLVNEGNGYASTAYSGRLEDFNLNEVDARRGDELALFRVSVHLEGTGYHRVDPATLRASEVMREVEDGREELVRVNMGRLHATLEKLNGVLS